MLLGRIYLLLAAIKDCTFPRLSTVECRIRNFCLIDTEGIRHRHLVFLSVFTSMTIRIS